MKPETARRLVRDALKRGDLIRADTCNRCGSKPPPAKDGRSQIHGHHHDYSKPLDVEWICAACHREETPLPDVVGAPVFGAKNGAAKLTDADVQTCKQLHAQGLTFRKIGERLGVAHTTVMRAVKGEHWSLAAAPAQPTDNTDKGESRG